MSTRRQQRQRTEADGSCRLTGASFLHSAWLPEKYHKSKCCDCTLYFQAHLPFLSLNVGHDKPVSSVSWSLSRHWWLSASEDPSVRIWTNDNSEPAIIMVIDSLHLHIFLASLSHDLSSRKTFPRSFFKVLLLTIIKVNVGFFQLLP